MRAGPGGLHFLVTGCSRSGTGYAARLFSELGIPCGHEAVFNIHHLRPRYCVPDFGDSPWSGDASFLAAPFLEALPRPALVLHQLRHPLAVIRSHVGIRFFGEEPRASFHLAENHADFLQVVEAAAPEVFREPDEATRCAAYWVRWNRMVERSARRARLDYVRYRLEDLDGPLLERLLARMGAAVPRARIRRALADVPRDVNHRQREESVGLGHLGPGGTQDALCALARRYGYPLAPAGAGPGPLPA